jgi:hypothetical protein
MKYEYEVHIFDTATKLKLPAQMYRTCLPNLSSQSIKLELKLS